MTDVALPGSWHCSKRMDLTLPYTVTFFDGGVSSEVSYLYHGTIPRDLWVKVAWDLGFACSTAFILGTVEQVKLFLFFFLMEQRGRVFVAHLGKEAVEKLCRCVLILADISVHCDTELPVWQPRVCNIVCLLRQVVMVRL